MQDNTLEVVRAWFKYKGRLYMATIKQEGIGIARKDGRDFDREEVYEFAHSRIKRLLKKYRP